MNVPGTTGQLCLFHFPAKKHAISAKKQGCVLIVTLQAEREDNLKKVKGFCDKLGMEWAHVDFWKAFYDKSGRDGLISVLQMCKNLLSSGMKVLVHCAAGIHRTGMFAYILLRMCGTEPRESYEYLRTLREYTRQNVGDDRINKAEQLVQEHKLAKPGKNKPIPEPEKPAAPAPVSELDSFKNMNIGKLMLDGVEELKLDFPNVGPNKRNDDPPAPRPKAAFDDPPPAFDATPTDSASATTSGKPPESGREEPPSLPGKNLDE